MVIKISGWYGRLGNNITQIVNAIGMGVYYKTNVCYPVHENIKGNQITISEKDSGINITGDFFSRKKLRDKYRLDDDIWKKENILPILEKITIFHQKIEMKKDDLVIHIRSGDIFEKDPHPGWVQPPLDFYEHVLRERSWKKIYLISEDQKNPVIKKLLEKHKDIIYKKNNLKKDISYIIHAYNICFGFGSFIPSLILFNKNLKWIYYPSYCYRYMMEYYSGNFKTYSLPDYIKVGKWKCDEKQLKMMLEYKIK